MALTKLDVYDYNILPGVIRINVTGTNDPVLVDVLSEIEDSGGRIYVDGKYYIYLEDYNVYVSEDGIHMDLQVVEAN